MTIKSTDVPRDPSISDEEYTRRWELAFSKQEDEQIRETNDE